MKKRLFLMLSLLAGMAGANAYEVNDSVYTFNGRFVIRGENLIPNGDFSNGTTGWTNTAGGELNPDTLVVDNGVGPNGHNALTVLLTGSKDSGVLGAGTANLMRSIPVDQGNYIVSYKVRGAAASSTTSTAGGNSVRSGNFQSFYKSASTAPEVIGTKSENQISNYITYRNADGWTEVNYNVTVSEAGNINILFFNLLAGDSFTDFCIQRADQIFDDRELTDLYNEYKVYVDAAGDNAIYDPQWDMRTVMDIISGAIAGDPTIIGNGGDVLINVDDPNSLTDFMDELQPYVDKFLYDNSVDVSSFLRNFSFDANSYSGWTTTGSRWKTSEPTGNFTTSYVYQDIPGLLDLGEGSMEQSYNLPAGKYMYMLQAQGYKYFVDGSGGSNNKTIVDYYNSIENCRMWMGEQSLTLTDMPTWKGKKYSIVADLPAGEKAFGFYDSGSANSGEGGHHMFDNLHLRIFGADSVEVVTYVYNEVARHALEVMRDSAVKVQPMTEYPFGKDVLQDSIDLTNVILNQQITAATRADIARAQEQMDWMRSAIQAYYTLNAEYVSLAAGIATAQAAYDDAERTEGKDALKAAINTATEYYNSFQTNPERDSLGLVTATQTLASAVDTYYAANAGYFFPGEVTIVNPSFADKGTGWVVTSSSESKEAWKYGSDANFTGGSKIYVNRGNTTSPDNAVFQTVTLAYNGMYELSFQAYANGQGRHDGNGVQDTINVYFVTEMNGVKDSLMIHTWNDNPDQSWFIPKDFKVRVFVDNAPVELKFGIDALNNPSSWPEIGSEKFATNYAYGSNKLTYYGDYDKYVQDSIKAVLIPTRDSLQRAIDAANALLNEARNPNGVSTSPFSTAIATAQGVCSDETSSLDALNAQFPLLEEATNNFMISGVWPAEGKSYDLSFMIKNADFLDQTADFAYWNPTGLAAGFKIGDNGYLSYLNETGASFEASSLTQEVTGLPNGSYQFKMSATYRYTLSSKEIWDTENYAEGSNTYMYIGANGNVTYVNGLLMEGALGSNNNWVLDDNTQMSLYDYRHGPYVSDLFDAGYYNSAVEFNVADGKANIGIYIEGLPINSYVFMQRPEIIFWGDTVADGIDGVQNDNSAAVPGDIYTVSGVKVRSNATSFEGLGKGIYIKNGKKFVIK